MPPDTADTSRSQGMRSVNLSCSTALDAAVAAIENTPSTMPRTLDQIRMTLRGNADTGYAVVDADTGKVVAEGPLDKKRPAFPPLLHAGLPTLWLQNVDHAGVPLGPPILYMKVAFHEGSRHSAQMHSGVSQWRTSTGLGRTNLNMRDLGSTR